MKIKSNLTEKKLTKAELEAREKVIKDLKKNKSALVKRYGKDAEAVMYGRATNIAKKMAESENKNRIKELVKKSLMQEADIEVDADRYEGEQELSQASAMLDDLETKLNNHDWFYMMADDNRAYTSGSAKEREIRDLISKLESMGYGKEAKDMYNEKEPYSKAFGRDSKLKEAKGKDMDKDGDIDSDDYLAARDAAIKKAKGEIKEDWGSSDQSIMNQGIHKDLGNPTEFPSPFDPKFESAVESAVDFYWDEWPEYRTDRDGLINHAKKLYYRAYFPEKFEGFMKMFGESLNEDIDLGHQDNEPHMIKGELYHIGKYAMKLYAIMEELEEAGGEYDLPAWWQSKITTAKNMMSSAKHYLDFELKEPAIDAAVDALTGEEPHMGEPMMEAEISAEEKLAGKIAKALKDIANKDASDQSNLKQARTALNKGNIEAAKKIAKPYIAEKLAKQLKSK
jgi:hypothetical protein